MTRPRSDADERNLELTGRIVAAYLIRNVVSIGDLPCVIEQTYAALRGASRTLQATQQPVVQERRRPAVPVRKSVTEDFIICLGDGKRFKLLRRHLMAKYGRTPEQYRRKWRLPADYPMAAPSYARERSKSARASGLGRTRAKVPPILRTARPFEIGYIATAGNAEVFSASSNETRPPLLLLQERDGRSDGLRRMGSRPRATKQ